jgi:hypothetical protein
MVRLIVFISQLIKEKRTDLSRKRIPLNQNRCTADFRMNVPFEQNLRKRQIIRLGELVFL